MSCPLGLPRLLGVAADNLDLVGLDGNAGSIHLELNVSNEESPYFVAESVRVEASLQIGTKEYEYNDESHS